MKIRPNVAYTRDDVAAFRDDPELAGILLKGYVFTLTIGGDFMLVPWNEAAGGGYTGKPDGEFDPHSGGSTYGAPKEAIFDKTELPPIVKRTPQQRVDSLMKKVGEDLRFYLSGAAGRELTGDETQEVVAKSLQTADDAFDEAESKRFARTTGSQYA